jgi:hypothetical protein
MEDQPTKEFRFSRLIRTEFSEVYLIWDNDTRVGEVHLHYTNDTIHATILLEVELQVADEEALLDLLDADVVSSYMPSFEREDFLITIYKAEELSSFSYASNDFDDFEMDEEDEEE